MTISLDKTYRTECGYEVRLLMVDGGGSQPVIGAFKHEFIWRAARWCNDGKYMVGAKDDYDLVEVKPVHKIKVWINFNRYSQLDHVAVGGAYPNWERANAGGCNDRIACIEREIEFTEGEGLE